jgi:hypothetical protein
MIKRLIKGYEDRFGSAYISILFVFVSIVPAAILFSLASSSMAEIIFKESQYIQAAKFGGAPALFIATFAILMWQHKNMTQPSAGLFIKRTLLDSEGNLLKGAKVVIAGENRSAETDSNGYFSLQVDSALTEWHLIVNFNGQNEQITVKKNEINIAAPIQLKKKQ